MFIKVNSDCFLLPIMVMNLNHFVGNARLIGGALFIGGSRIVINIIVKRTIVLSVCQTINHHIGVGWHTNPIHIAAFRISGAFNCRSAH